MTKRQQKSMEKELRKLRRRRMLIRLAIKGVVILLFGFFVSFIGRWLYRYFYSENDYFLFRELRMQQTPHFTQQGVQTFLEELGEKDGCIVARTNILTLDLKKIHDKLAENPLVEKVEVTRQLPSTLIINITERNPVAFLSHNQNICGMVDRKGVVFPFLPTKTPPPKLPFITNLPEADKLPMGMENKDFSMQAAIFLINHINTRQYMDNGAYRVYQIEINSKFDRLNCLMLPLPNNKVFPQKGTNLYIPMDTAKIPQALERLDEILKDKIATKSTLKFADLTMETNVYTFE